MRDGKPSIVFVAKDKWSSQRALEWLDHRLAGTGRLTVVTSGEVAAWVKHGSGYALYEDLRDVPPMDGRRVLVSFLAPRRFTGAELARFDLAINFHPAPLPEYRGLWGVSRAILDGVDDFGVAAHLMTAVIDAGPIVLQHRFTFAGGLATAKSLDKQTQRHLLRVFRDVMPGVLAGETVYSTEQASALGVERPPTRAKLEDMKGVSPADSPDLVERKSRAFWYPPHDGATVRLGGIDYTLVPAVALKGIW